MNSNRVKWGAGLIALVVLTFGLAGCGSEPAPVVRPPAPPPAPPPFQPQPVEVALGEHGGTVTLMTAEGGGYTLDGEAFAGGEVEAENGNKYLLALEDDKWTAVFQAAEGIEVMLGDHGGTVTITVAENGTYWIGEMEIESGGTVTAENGNMYTLTMTMDEEGNAMWSAMYAPMEGMVTVASLGLEIAATRAEDGTWTAVHPLTQETVTLTEGGTIMAGDNTYMLSSDGMGMWTATFVMPDPVSVMLGDHGGHAHLQRAENGTWWIGDDEFASGGMVMGDNGHYYTLTMGDDGMWMAMWNQPDPVTVTLGTSGTVDLQQAENLTWWIGDMEFSSGGTYRASNGNVYTLTMNDDGMWSSMFTPGTMDIMGTSLTAVMREDGMGYDVMGSEDTIPESGMGDVTVGSAMYHVWMDDGMLMGAQFDAAINGDTDMSIGDIALPTLSGDDEDTVGNELRTKLNVADRSFSIGTLMGQGSETDMGDIIVAKVLEAVTKVRNDVNALLSLDTELTGLTGILNARWSSIQTELNKIFDGDVNIDRTPADTTSITGPDSDEILSEIDDIINALESEDAFVAATMEDGNGVFEDAKMSADDASKAFNAAKTETMVNFGMTGSTRYGAVWQKQRDTAKDDLKYTMAVEADENASPPVVGVDRMGYVGAFSWSTEDDVNRRHQLPSSGSAIYDGETRAVSGDGILYRGVIQIEVRFRTNRVSGLITDLRTESDGMAWEYQFGAVESIILPTATLRNTADWSHSTPDADVTSADQAQITYLRQAGSPRPQGIDSMFTGTLSGPEVSLGQYDYANASGTWSVGGDASDGNEFLAGGYGAVRTSESDDTRPGTDDGSTAEATVFSTYGDGTQTAPIPAGTVNQKIADGMLTLTTDKWGRSHAYDTATPRTETSVDDTYTFAAMTHDHDNDATTDPINQDQAFEIDLVALMADPDEHTVNLDTQVAVAKAALEKARGDLSVLQGLETRVPSSESAQWTAVQQALVGVFQFVPPKFAGDYDEDEALGLIERALDALSTEDALADAVDPDGSGVFKGAAQSRAAGEDDTLGTDDDVLTAVAVGDIWGRVSARVKLWSGMTDYTRFGAWRKERNEYAGTGYSNPTGATEARDLMQVFAYSQLKPTEYRAGDRSFPSGGKATYSGGLVAIQGAAFVEGDVMVSVTWAAALTTTAPETTSLVATFSNLRQAANGDPLNYYNGTAAMEVDSIILSGAAINANREESGDNMNQIRFAGTPDVRVKYADASVTDELTAAFAGTNSISGVFVGQSPDGPRGVLGMFSLDPADDFDHDGDGTTDALDRFGLGTGALMGAFGADAP